MLLPFMSQQQIWSLNTIYAICPKYSVCTYWGSMPIYMPYMKWLQSMMESESLHTDHTANNNDNATVRLNRLSWPIRHISQYNADKHRNEQPTTVEKLTELCMRTHVMHNLPLCYFVGSLLTEIFFVAAQ